MSDVSEIPDAVLLRRVIEGLCKSPWTARAHTVPLWSKVGDHFALGSTYSAQLCRRFDFNPDEQVRP